MKEKTIFISYNPTSAAEQTLALRLHTIGAVNGFKMFLPDRFNSETYIDDSTKVRINEAGFFVVFSTSPLSTIVKQEIEYAYSVLRDASKIIVIYSKHVGKNLKGDIVNHFTSVEFDPLTEGSDIVINKIFNAIFQKQQQDLTQKIQEETNAKAKKELKKQQEETTRLQNALLAVLGIGVGLMILNEILNNK